MNNVFIELTHEEHYQLLDVLRLSKEGGGFPQDETERRIWDARRLLHLPDANRWKFHDWTPEDEKKEREEENRRQQEMMAYMFNRPPTSD